MTYRAVKGMNDLLPDEIERWHQLESTFRGVVERCRYAEARTPILEHTSLFVRSIGETTDVVEKEMFTFGRSNESLSMRPEGTAGAARAYLERKVYAREPVSRWYYLGPMFRAERPQRGRYRQFYQAGGEVYGDPGPVADAEMIDMLVSFFAELNISGLQVCINSIGGAEARAAHRVALLEYLRPRAANLSEHARARMEANPLRVLDSKDERDQAVVADAPSILGHLPADDRLHWDNLRRGLDALGTPYEVRPGLVRGLDYYTRTLFEINATTGSLGAQNTLVGGGRYDAMLESLGGPRIPAIGFAMGLERVLLAMSDHEKPRCPFCFVAPIGERAQTQALRLARDLRNAGLVVDLDGRGSSLKAMLRRADSCGARVCLVLGDSEMDRGVVQVKDLVSHQQHEFPLGDFVPRVTQLIEAAQVAQSSEDA